MIRLIRHIRVLIWLFVLVVLVSACSFGEDPDGSPDADLSGTDSPGNDLRIDVECDFGPFTPLLEDISGSIYSYPFIYSFLFVPDPAGKLMPDLAVAWAYDPQNFTWRIDLRKDAFFHNGDPVTAADVVFSIQSAIEHRIKSMEAVIKNIKGINPYCLEIQLKQDDPALPFRIWDMSITPAPDRHANLDPDKAPVGSGPFIFDRLTDDARVLLLANDNYYNGRPKIDRVVLHYIPDREKTWARLLKGETDIAGNIRPKNYDIMEQYGDRFYFDKYPGNYYTLMLYNTGHPLFENPLVRQALTHAIDRETMVSEMLGAMAEVVAGPMGNHSPWRDPDLTPLSYDPYLALEYLKKAGWTLDPDTQCLMNAGRAFEFNLLLPAGSETDLRIARFIKLNLNEVGTRVRLKALPLDELVNRYFRNNNFDAVLVEMSANVRRPEEFLGQWVSSEVAVASAGGFYSPEATRLAGRVVAEKDPKTRKMLFHQFDRLIAELQPASFLFQKLYLDAMSQRISVKYPFTFDHPGFYRLQYARLNHE